MNCMPRESDGKCMSCERQVEYRGAFTSALDCVKLLGFPVGGGRGPCMPRLSDGRCIWCERWLPLKGK